MASKDDMGAALEMIETGYAALAEQSFDTQSHAELLDVQSRLEVLARKHPVLSNKIIARLAAEADPKALGAKSLADLMATRLRISVSEAKRRIKHASLLGPRTAMSGEPLAPVLAHVAAAQARGQIGSEHVRIAEKFFQTLPTHLDWSTREAAETHLAQMACGLWARTIPPSRPAAGAAAQPGRRRPRRSPTGAAALPHDGQATQHGMTELHGLLDPQAAATLEAVLAKWAAPRMCNPDDAQPC